MRAFLMFSVFCMSLMGKDLSWGFPVTLSSPDVDASFPQIGMDSFGNATAAWIEDGFVKSRRQPFGGKWSSIMTVSTQKASSLRCVVSPAGVATALWLEDGVVKSSDLLFDNSWSEPVVLSDRGASSLELAVDTEGNLVAVWSRSGNIESSMRLVGGKWPSSSDLIESTGAELPSVSIGSDGSVVVVWQALVDSIHSVYAATAEIGKVWNPPELLSSPLHDSGYPQVYVNGNGDILAGWFRWDVKDAAYFNVVCQTAIRWKNRAWTAPEDISLSGVRIPCSVKVALDDFGNAIAVWDLSQDGSSYHIQFAVKPAAGSWSESEDLLGDNLVPCDLAAGFFNGRFRIALLCSSDNDGFNKNLNILTTSTGIGTFYAGQWSNLAALSTKGWSACPKIASIVRENLIYGAAVWKHYNGSQVVIQVSLGKGTVLSPPKEVLVEQQMIDFKVFQKYQNVLHWVLPSDASESIIYRNGLLVANVYAPSKEYIDHNQVQNEKVIYGVAVLDDKELEQSATVFVEFPPRS